MGGQKKRTYEATHSWINFRVDLSRAPRTLWLLLGEARSKCEHVEGVPLAPEISRKLSEVYLVKGVHATAAIEANSLSVAEIEQRMQGKLELPPSKEYLGQEIDNLVRAFNSLLAETNTRGPRREISPALIKKLNGLVLEGLPPEEGTVPGQVRAHSVGVADDRGAPAEDCEYLLDRLCTWLNEVRFDGDQDLGSAGAILRAIIAHLYLAWIHPFGDGNGRTARLLEFSILVNAGIPLPSAHLLSGHYDNTRQEYYRNLAYSSKSGGDVLPFFLYAVRGFVDELREQLQFIRSHQWDVAWRNFVNELFEEEGDSAAQARRKCLLLDLGRRNEPVPRGELALLSPRVAAAYAKMTEKALSRDLNLLIDQKLVSRTPKGYRARKELILAFLPPAWKPEQGPAP